MKALQRAKIAGCISLTLQVMDKLYNAPPAREVLDAQEDLQAIYKSLVEVLEEG